MGSYESPGLREGTREKMKRSASYFSLVLVAATAIAGGVCSECRADERAEAKEHYIKGTKAFELGAYEEAIAEYSAAYRLKDDAGSVDRLARKTV